MKNWTRPLSIFWVPILAILGLRSAPACAVDGNEFVLNGATTILIDSREPAALQRAAANLVADLEMVLGVRVPIVRDPRNSGESVIWIALERQKPVQVHRPSGHERLHIEVVERPGLGSPAARAIVLTGSDVRGAIYAIYQFSEKFLGVDPLYWWTDAVPKRRIEVRIPQGYAETDGPVFRYRGWFINDEDLLTGWKPGLADGTGISLDVWDRIFEAILRLKGNMVIPGTWIFPDEPQIRAAVQRGLIVTQNHVNTVGLNTYRWPRDKPMSYVSAPSLLKSAWTRAVEQYPDDAEVLWTVGFRGQQDQPFWAVDPNAPSSMESRARLIRAAIDDQIKIVRSRYPRAKFFMNTYGEMSTFLQQGMLKVPDNVVLIQADDGRGTLRSRLSGIQGVYYHTAMVDGVSNHYTEMIPLERIQQELGRTVRMGATEMLLVNTANVRPVLMTTRAVMELAWNPAGWTHPNSNRSGEYLDRWSREQFGEEAAPLVTEYYKAYFKAPARFGSAEDLTMGDEFYYTAARELLSASGDQGKVKVASSGEEKKPWLLSSNVSYRSGRKFESTEEFARLLSGACSAAESRWKRAKELAEKARAVIPEDRTQFFQATVVAPVEMQLHLNSMLMYLAEMVAKADGPGKIRMLSSAIDEGNAAAEALRTAEYGKWKGFYTQGDWLFDTQGMLAHMRAHLARLKGHAGDIDLVWRNDFAGHADSAYARITAYQGNRRADH